MTGSAPAIPGGPPASPEAGFETAPQNPRSNEGFSLLGSVARLPFSAAGSAIQKGREILSGNHAETTEPLYSVEGIISIAGHETRYTITGTESCDPGKGLALFVPGLIGFKTTSKPISEANAQIGDEYTLRLGTARDDVEERRNNFKNPLTTQVNAISAILDDAKGNKDIRNGLPGGDKIDFDALILIMHSLGGANGTEFILKNQSKVKESRYLASVGLGSPTLNQLTEDNISPGGAKDLVSDLLPVFATIFQREGVGGLYKSVRKILHYHQRPERVAAEIILCLTANIEEKVQQIEADTSLQEYGLDTLVRPDPKRAKLVGQYSLIPDLRHCAPQHSPEVVAEVMHAKKKVSPILEAMPQAA